MSDAPIMTRAKMRKNRWVGSLGFILLGIPGALAGFYYSPLVLRYFDPQVGSLTVGILQCFVVAICGVVLFSPIAHILALVNENQFKENAWGEKSRYAMLWDRFYFGLVIMSAFLLGTLAALNMQR